MSAWGGMTFKNRSIAVLGLTLLIGGFLAFTHRGDGPRHYFVETVARGDIRDVVEATGIVNPVVTVLVGSQVSGTIATLYADFNSQVHRGEVIARIDPSLFEGALQQAVADSESAVANVAAARAGVEKAKATLVQAKADFNRNEALAGANDITQQQLELARAAYDGAQASLDGAAATVKQAEGQASQKTAAVTVARANLAYTVIRSPINGTVVARNVDVGQTVAASLQAPTLFTIAQDLTKMQVYAKVDESDIGRITLGRSVTFKVDAFPKDAFHGAVSQIRMNPASVQNVVTYDVIIDFGNPELKLFPGMTAYVTIPVAGAHDVVKVPNAALRYHPPVGRDAIQGLFRKYGIDSGTTASTSPGDSVAHGARSGSPRDTAIVWKLHPDHTIEPVKVVLGITDHAYTEVVSFVAGALADGDQIITGSVAAKPQTSGSPR